VYSILNDNPEPIAAIRSGFPSQLQRIVDKMLTKAPGERYENAAQLLADLESCVRDSGPMRISGPGPDHAVTRPTRSRRSLWPTAGLGALLLVILVLFGLWLGRAAIGPFQKKATTNRGRTSTIAVLPFVNMSPDPNQDYFSDGMSEELLNLLTKVTELRVAARTSSFSFKGQNVEIPEIAKRLNVAYVLEGSVRKAGDQVRITAQLVHANDGFHVWSETYDRKLDDIFAIQDEIAADVVKQLRITLLGKMPKARKTNPEAYALYLESVQLSRQNTKDGFEKSDALLHRVLEIDSAYAPAWAGLAANFGNKAVGGLLPPEEGFARAREANMRALQIDPQYAPAYAGLAFDAMYGQSDFAAAAKYLERAVALDPANTRALGNSAMLLNLLGRKDEAVKLWEAITIRDALNLNALFNQGTSQLDAGQLDDAIATYRMILSLSPGNGVAHYQVGVAMLLKGDANGALAEFKQESVEVFRMIGLPMAYFALGRKAESDAALAEFMAKYGKGSDYNIAGIHAFRGEADIAFEWLEKERENGGTFVEIVVDPLFANLYNDPRWIPFLRRIGKAPEQLAKISFKVTPP
jgi:TolB-like protein